MDSNVVAWFRELDVFHCCVKFDELVIGTTLAMYSLGHLSILAYAYIFCSTIAAYLSAKCVYRLYFHPLAKYPGPWLAKVTSLYGAYHSYIGDIHADMWMCHEKYGNLVRYHPNRLLFATNTALKEIYGYGTNLKKAAAYHQFPTGLAYSTHNAVDKEMHRRKRRLVNQAFSASSVKIWNDALMRQITVLCEELDRPKDDGWSSPFKMSDWCLYLMSDIVSDAVFSGSFQTLTNQNKRYLLELVHKSYEWIGIIFQSPKISMYGLDRFLIPRLSRDRALLRGIFGSVLQERLEKSPEQEDIYSVYLNAKDPETQEHFPRVELGAEALLLFGAGPDATSVSMASALWYLARTDGALHRVYSEVRSAFSTVHDIVPGIKLQGCHFLHACINEAQRMNPVNGGALWREIEGGAASIDGEVLPAGIDVGVGIYSIQHQEKYFPDAFRYRPERWIVSQENPQATVDLARSAWSPYSTGPRGCVGRPVAIVELMLSLARIFFLFDMRLPLDPILAHMGEGKRNATPPRNRPEEFQAKGTFSSILDGPMLQFKRNALKVSSGSD